MHLFLCWRPMQDRIGSLGHMIERCLWGDGRALHTFLLASTDEYPLVLIEIDVGDSKKGIRKSMKLNIIELDEIPKELAKIEFIGEIKSQNALEKLIQSAHNYVRDHPNYHVLLNNCRTFVEYLIDEIPEFHNSIPHKNNSILEYYHSQAKHEHPGALVKSKKILKQIRDIHQYNKEYKYTGKLVLDIQSLALDINTNNVQTVEKQL
ncbi:unnamed protein product [Rotaria sp. Silwood2]|nr:unnamed protein product [Rotaria sp. Silwood2]CAF2833450.1 unnamed protein product [Rotaria sp. Silwood2]CAF2977543.1 unnamed protein product [Rotaria sp. Silwood2]CAF3105490.1 unnamed protein product [Rotaria sp. Silwood2]CAF4350752.1 unnamed protein product [Rotaria sp. Silwood2]